MFTSQDHQLTKISPILQAWFLYSVNIFLQKIGPKSSLQPATVLFSNHWWGIRKGVLNYDPFRLRRAPKQRKIILRKTVLRLTCILPQNADSPARLVVFNYSLAQRQNPQVPGVWATDFSGPGCVKIVGNGK